MVSEGGQKHVAIMEQKGTTIRKPNRKKKPDVVSPLFFQVSSPQAATWVPLFYQVQFRLGSVSFYT